MKTDIQIAQEASMLHIKEIAKKLNLSEDDYDQYGRYKAKLNIKASKSKAKLILVTAITPTPAGEGKSTVSVGLNDALNKIGKNSIATLREPSLGPVFGIKGGATGGGYSQVVPMEDINLHFTGDIHAIGVANNLISACIDNHIKFGNVLNIDVTKITWKRVVDMNDRSLRNIVIGMGGKASGIPRQDSFQITVASEIMAGLCLSTSLDDLKEKIGEMVFALDTEGNLLKIKQLKIEGAVTALLKEAIKPNLVQSLENNPVLIHGGPFANIAHGCNSLIATKLAMGLTDYVVTEAGFAADLGAEKFFDIKCRKGNLKPDAVVIVATIRALKHHGSLEKGLENLDKHIENMKKFNLPVIVAINKFADDEIKDIEIISNYVANQDVKVSLCDVWAKGGEGAIELAKELVKMTEKESNFKPLYNLELTIKDKIEKIASEIYGAKGVSYSKKAIKMIDIIEKNGYNLPICVSKTQKSISDNPSLLGKPKDFILTINEIRLSAGAGFVVAMAGNIIDMPGLPKKPSAELIDVVSGKITGLF